MLEVAEPAGDAAAEFDDPVDGLGATVARAVGVEVGQERCLPAAQRLAEAPLACPHSTLKSLITSKRTNGATTESMYRAYALGSSSGPGHYPGSIATHQLKASPLTRDSCGRLLAMGPASERPCQKDIDQRNRIGVDMKAVVYEGPRQVSTKDVPDAKIERPTDVLVRVTTRTSAARTSTCTKGGPPSK